MLHDLLFGLQNEVYHIKIEKVKKKIIYKNLFIPAVFAYTVIIHHTGVNIHICHKGDGFFMFLGIGGEVDIKDLMAFAADNMGVFVCAGIIAAALAAKAEFHQKPRIL